MSRATPGSLGQRFAGVTAKRCELLYYSAHLTLAVPASSPPKYEGLTTAGDADGLGHALRRDCHHRAGCKQFGGGGSSERGGLRQRRA